MMFNYSMAVLSGYFFWRHDTYCEDNMYSYFSICEWLFVISNIAFHCTIAFVDFRHVVMYMTIESTSGGRKLVDQ
jgi:Frag1/DRAM/Sfk1 family.